MDAALDLTIADATGHELDQLRYSNARQRRFRFDPGQIAVKLSWPADLVDGANPAYVVLDLPEGWESVPSTVRFPDPDQSSLIWTVYPRTAPPGFQLTLGAELRRGRDVIGETSRDLRIQIEGYNQFDPERDRLPWANDVEDLGVVGPEWPIFDQTFGWMPFPQLLFKRLYSEILHLGPRVGSGIGGLCTGIARAALAHSLHERPVATTLREEIAILQGRQLTDRALITGLFWFLAPSPRRAYHYFRNQLIGTGKNDICFDIGVPRPLRRDVIDALQHQGHTVVPYAFEQSSPDRASVLVYDPNDPPEERVARRITFDLSANRYQYQGLASLDESGTTVIPVGQAAYEQGRTAFLAWLASALDLRQAGGLAPAQQVTLMGLGLGLAAGLAGAVAYRATRSRG